jgi:hypothetical protein
MKIIRKQEADATSMTRLEYNKFRGWELPDDENGDDKGYKLVSGDHVSWIPEEIFQKECVAESNSKSLGNTDANGATKNVKDIQFWGDGDTFKLISKASSQNEAWMKSTKAMQIDNVGCVVQVTTQQGSNVAEAVNFVPGVKIEDIIETDEDSEDGKIIGRKLVAI